MAIIQALYFDYSGRVTGRTEETDTDFANVNRTPLRERTAVQQVNAAQLFLLERGTQRRPANPGKRFQ
jgi:hypothetical protein